MNQSVAMDVLLPEWLSSRLMFIKYEVVYNETVDNWFLMQSWFPVTTIVLVYLIFVNIVGPRMMENRKPYDIRNIMLVYNLIQTLYNAYIVSNLFVPGAISHLYRHSCTPMPRDNNPLWWTFTKASHLFYLSKIMDLLDTVFFILRKKQSHISFLHVYHHSMMVMATWGFLRFFKGEQGVFIGLLNSLVHVVMYSYYFLAALGPEVQKYLWWKKYITKFQLTQFALFCIHQLSLIFYDCKMPIVITYFIFSQAVVMIVLFGNFYYQTYHNTHNRRTKVE